MTCRWRVPTAQLRGGRLELTGEGYHYLVRVRRLAPGAVLTLFDGSGLTAAAQLVAIDSQRAVLDVGEPEQRGSAIGPQVELLLSLVKGDRTDWAVEKVTELGVARIRPFVGERTVVRPPPERAEQRAARLRAIAEAAARQSRRATVPQVEEIAPLCEVMAAVSAEALRLVLWEQASDRNHQALRQVLPVPAPSHIALLIGPEGGFAKAEIEAAQASGWTAVGLGSNILRAETAAVAAVAAVQFAVGNLD
jgi:16S rRNA (uracil1498-N3)-methyltransferase